MADVTVAGGGAAPGGGPLEEPLRPQGGGPTHGSHRASGPRRPPPTVDVRAAAASSLPSWRAVLVGAWISLAGAVLIALRELDGLIAQVLVAGETVTLTGLSSTGFWGSEESWDGLAAKVLGGDAPLLGGWMRAYAGLDLLFIVLYSLPVVAFLGRHVGRRSPGRGWWVLGLAAIVLAVVADVCESGLVLAVASGSEVGAAFPWVSGPKWGALAIVLLTVVVTSRDEDVPRGPRGRSGFTVHESRSPVGALGRVLRALYTHRFSLLVVVPFAVLGLVNGTDILDQIPDVQRRWIDDDPAARFWWSALLNVIVSVVVIAVGRLRSHHVAMRVLPAAAPYRRQAMLPWAVTAAVIAVGALASLVLGQSLEGMWWRLVPALAVPLLVLAASSWFYRRCGAEPVWSPYRRPLSAQQAVTTRTVGDVLGVLVLVIPSLGLVRAFSGPLALAGDGVDSQVAGVDWVGVLPFGDEAPAAHWRVVLLLVGVVAAAATWPAARFVGLVLARMVPRTWLTAFTPGLVLPDPTKESRARFGGWFLLTIGVLAFVAVGLLPSLEITPSAVIELMLVAVTAVALPLGATVILLQGGGAPDILSRRWTPALRTAPVMTIIVLTAALVGLSGNSEKIHGLRQLPAGPLPHRDTLVDRLDHLQSTGTCASPLVELEGVDGTKVTHAARPVFVFAAEGGGIRAAAWTALGVDAMQEAGGTCADALMSSGASGGAVGLTIAGFTADGEAYAATSKIAGPEGLGSAVTGLLVRDPVRSVTGIAFPTAERDEGWVDRAGLMEQSWESELAQLTEPFLDGVTDRSTGALVLNSTSVSTQCRTLLSQVSLDEHPDPLSCHTPTAPTDSVDLLPTLRSGCEGEDGVHRLRASTVALLASRFPYVTPSGVVTGCHDGTPVSQQIVDGGYADNDGIGTVVDLSPQWLPALRDHNAAVLDAGGGEALLVPVLVYLDNGTGSDIAKDPGGDKNEVLVPLLTKGGATAGLSGTDAQLHRALAAFSTASVVPGCGLGPASARRQRTSAQDPKQAANEQSRDKVCAAIDSWRGAPVKVFYQPSRPSISAPLGWVLSGQSLTTLECARDGQVSPVLAPRAKGCDDRVVVADEGSVDATLGGCPVERTSWDDEVLLEAKGYGSMLSALCLAREARDAPPLTPAAAPSG